MTDIDGRWHGGQVTGDDFKAPFCLAKDHRPIASWEHAIQVYLLNAKRAKAKGSRWGVTEQVNNHNSSWTRSEALLIGRIFDDRGNRMTPSHSRKRGLGHRYYVSSALFHGRAKHTASVRRVSAPEIEALVIRSLREHCNQVSPINDRTLINTHLVRVEVRSYALVIHLCHPKESEHRPARGHKVLHIPWQKTSAKRRREILVPNHMPTNKARPIRSENRALLVASIAHGRQWLNELVTVPTATAESIAEREKCSVRKVNMTISLAFLAPDLVKAAIEGRLPHGMGVTPPL